MGTGYRGRVKFAALAYSISLDVVQQCYMEYLPTHHWAAIPSPIAAKVL